MGEASDTWLSTKAAEEGRLQRMGEDAVLQRTAAAAALEEASREQRVADGLRKVGDNCVWFTAHICV